MIYPVNSGIKRIVLVFFSAFLSVFSQAVSIANMQPQTIRLNPPVFKQGDFLTLLEKRYSCRKFKERALKLDDLGSILWAACGKKQDAITQATRTTASAGATYPLELFLVTGKNGVDKLSAGVYHYSIEGHALESVKDVDLRAELASACLGQDFIRQAPVSIVIAAEFSRTTLRYGARGERYVYLEAGHASQNANLAVYGLALATVEVGAFSDARVSEVLGLEKELVPLIIMPVGYP